jgi:hypothetical protein
VATVRRIAVYRLSGIPILRSRLDHSLETDMTTFNDSFVNQVAAVSMLVIAALMSAAPLFALLQ